MSNYSAMSDFEINKAVAIHLGMKPFDEETGWQGLTNEPYVDVIVRGAGRLGGFNPCNKAADAWPIIFRERITLTPKIAGYEWDAISPVILNDDIEHLHADKNPLRAAMIVFLMMKESSHG
ncbi:Protein of uncharacterised function (DUF2591) [Yersinia rohdei]|uniref:phage protein NinX family protein n=1 Tax=Yersinia rohdei TaxID=29485 RepID=UPI00061CB679|nr:phage protein NinX family protein [Yersinia rohdei]CNF26759.1 Protein of uncharacterised function (DUF2591) [Yersinia rohdei]